MMTVQLCAGIHLTHNAVDHVPHVSTGPSPRPSPGSESRGGEVEALDPERVLLLPDAVEDLWSKDYQDLISLA